MKKAWFRISLNQHGFSPVEVLLAATIFGFLAVGLIGAIVYGRASTENSGDRAAAVMLAEEGLQATRNLRNGAYSNLADGTYGLTQTSNLWALSGSSDVNGIYTRQITIASSGTNRKTVTSTVAWPQQSGTGQVSVVGVLSNWMSAIKSWAGGILAGSANPSGTVNGVKVATSGNYAYSILSATSNNFVVSDISNPAAPVISRTISITGTPSNIFVSGNYAYVSTNNTAGEMVVVNISNPLTASVAATYNAPGTAVGLGVYVSSIAGTNYAFLSRASSLTDNEFLVINVNTPTSPTLTGSFNSNLAMNEVYVSGNYAYVGVSSLLTPMYVINVSTPASPSLTVAWGLTLLANTITISGSGNMVYFGSGATLAAVNVSNPSAPSLSGTFTVSGTINDVDVDGANQLAFLGTAGTTGEFQVVNVSSPASMSLVRTVDVPGTASTISGVAYNAGLDVVPAVSYSDTQELIVFTKN